MDIRITTTNLSYMSRSTGVTVDLLEHIGSITRVAETLTLTLPGLYENNPLLLNFHVATELKAAGFDVMVPPDPTGLEPAPAQGIQTPSAIMATANGTMSPEVAAFMNIGQGGSQ